MKTVLSNCATGIPPVPLQPRSRRPHYASSRPSPAPRRRPALPASDRSPSRAAACDCRGTFLGGLNPRAGAQCGRDGGVTIQRRPEREMHPEGGPPAWLAFDGDRAVVGIDECLADREAEAGARDCAAGSQVGAEKALENARLIIGGDAHAVVGDGQPGAVSFSAEADRNMPPLGGEIHGVREQVVEQLGTCEAPAAAPAASWRKTSASHWAARALGSAASTSS